MFKILKKIVRTTENPTAANNSIVHHLEQTFIRLDQHSIDGGSLHLPSHKKKAIILTLAKLPIAASRAYSVHVIKKAFMLNGQLDIDHQLVPSLENCCNTYRGNIRGTCLEERKELIERLYERTFTEGMVEETRFDEMGIPKDTNIYGTTINREFTITNENRQRSKCLTSETQIQERLSKVLKAKLVVYHKKMNLYENEEKEYERNKVCEKKLIDLYNEYINKENQALVNNSNTPTTSTSPIQSEHAQSFSSLLNKLTYPMVKDHNGRTNILKCNMKSFVRVCSERTVKNGKITYLNVPELKDDLLKKLIELSNLEPNNKVHNTLPILPE